MPIIWITCSFFAGVISADILSWNFFIWFVLGIGGSLVLMGLFWIKYPGHQKLSAYPRGMILSLFISFILGWSRYLTSLPDFEDPLYLTNYVEEKSAWKKIREKPEVKFYLAIRLIRSLDGKIQNFRTYADHFAFGSANCSDSCRFRLQYDY